MYRLKAGNEFKRFFIHGIRDGKSEWDAAGEAMLKARREISAMLEADVTLSHEDRQIEWVNVIEFLMAFYMNMKDLVIDRDKLAELAEAQNRAELDRHKTEATAAIPGMARDEARENPVPRSEEVS